MIRYYTQEEDKRTDYEKLVAKHKNMIAATIADSYASSASLRYALFVKQINDRVKK